MSDLLVRLRGAIGDEGLEVPKVGVPIASPATEDEAQVVLRIATESKAPVLPIGNCTKLGWCPPAERVELCLSTRRLTGVVSYEPEDGTVTARAGTTMTELEETVHAGGHHLSPQVPAGDQDFGPTLGGVVAAGESGLDRLRYGPIRNVLLGTRAVYSDGRVAKSGGQLVKNVTGYELHKLHCGSHGSFCLITEASLRLFPSPPARAELEYEFASREEAMAASHHVGKLAIRPFAVALILSPGHPGRESRLSVLLAGLEAALLWEREQVLSALGEPSRESRDDERTRHHLLPNIEYTGDPWRRTILVLSCRPSRLHASLDLLDGAVSAGGLLPQMIVHPLVGRAAIRFDVGDQELDLESARALHEHLAGGAASLHWRNPPAGLWTEIAPAPDDIPGLTLMRRLRDALDPAGTFARGRLLGGTS